MPVIIELVAGNLSPSYAFQLKRNGAVIDLSTVVDVKMNIKNAQTDELTATGVVCSVTDAPNGIVQIAPTAAMFPSGERYVGEVKINHAGNLPEILDRYVDFIARESFV